MSGQAQPKGCLFFRYDVKGDGKWEVQVETEHAGM